MTGRRFTAIFWLFLVCLAVAPGQAEDRILFISSNETANGSFELYTMAADGTDVHRITTNMTSEWAPALAPDGNRIAYIAPTSGDIFITTLTGDAPVAVGNAHTATAVQWRDNDTLFYMYDKGGFPIFNYEIWRIRTDGSEETNAVTGVYDTFRTGDDGFHVDLVNARVHFADRLFPPITRSLIREAGLGTNEFPVFVMGECVVTNQPNTGGSWPTQKDHYDPAVSPDGSKIAYAVDYGEGSHRLYLRDYVGDCDSLVLLSDRFCGDPHWSPDSSWLAFTRAPSSTFGSGPYIADIYRVNANGASLSNITINIPTLAGGCAHPTIYSGGGASGFSIVGIERVDSRAEVTWESLAGRMYTLQYSVDATGNDWSNVPPHVIEAGADGFMIGTDHVGNVDFKVYRVQCSD